MERIKLNSVSYDKLILCRLGEITLKGLNRRRFVERILKTLRYRLRTICPVHVFQEHSRIWIEGKQGNDFPIAEILKAIKPVFGYVSSSPVRVMNSDIAEIEEEFLDYMREVMLGNEEKHLTFKVNVRRSDKSFEFNSYELASKLGAIALKAFPDKLKVKLDEPDLELKVEVREGKKTYIYHETYPAFRGLPVGMSGRGMLLLSGGIDSPVAGFQMASRGMQINAVYFHTHPYTSPEAKDKVIKLANLLSAYAGKIRLFVVDFTPCQLKLNEVVREDLLTVAMRRMMYRIAEELAKDNHCGALISGESLGQVASQTMEALQCIDYLLDLPVFRPLIGQDKDEIIRISREIGTYDTSILPYEDCCTVFVAKHPKTKPKISECEKAEEKLDIEALIDYALESVEVHDLQIV